MDIFQPLLISVSGLRLWVVPFTLTSAGAVSTELVARNFLFFRIEGGEDCKRGIESYAGHICPGADGTPDIAFRVSITSMSQVASSQ